MSEWAVFGLLAAAAWSDWRSRRIPNWLCAFGAVTGLAYSIHHDRIMTAILGAGCAFALTLIPVLLRGFGMGDQKLLMTTGIWTAAEDVYQLFLCSILSALIYCLLQVHRWRKLAHNFRLIGIGWAVCRSLHMPDREQSAASVPFAVHLLMAHVFLLMKGMN